MGKKHYIVFCLHFLALFLLVGGIEGLREKLDAEIARAMVTISPTFYEQLFLSKIVLRSFSF